MRRAAARSYPTGLGHEAIALLIVLFRHVAHGLGSADEQGKCVKAHFSFLEQTMLADLWC